MRAFAVPAAVVGWLVLLATIPVTRALESRVRDAGRADLVATTGAELVIFALAAFAAAGTGTVLMLHLPRHPVGWLFLLLGATSP